MVYLPASGVLFTGDVMMPYLGAPFFAEGSPEGLLDTLALIAELNPRTLVHGHTLLTGLFTADAVPGLLAALTELRQQSLAGIGRGVTLTGLLKASVLPEVLREHAAAVDLRTGTLASATPERLPMVSTDARFDSPRAVQVRFSGFDLPKLAKLGGA
ncbi:MAG: hypothetical protein ACRDNT_24705, partial [Streptosporangiaceae bacterium]